MFHDCPWFSMIFHSHVSLPKSNPLFDTFWGVRSAFHWRPPRPGHLQVHLQNHPYSTLGSPSKAGWGRLKKATPPLGPSSSPSTQVCEFKVFIISYNTNTSHIISYRYISRWKRTRSSCGSNIMQHVFTIRPLIRPPAKLLAHSTSQVQKTHGVRRCHGQTHELAHGWTATRHY